MREGVIKVLVCWHSDRVESADLKRYSGCLDRSRTRRPDRDRPKNRYSVQRTSGEAITAINAVIAHQESVPKSFRQKTAQYRNFKAGDNVYNNVPMGIQYVGDKYDREKIIPNRPLPAIIYRDIRSLHQRRLGELRMIASSARQSEGIPSPEVKLTGTRAPIRWTIRQRRIHGTATGPAGRRRNDMRLKQIIWPDRFDRANQSAKDAAKARASRR